MTSNTPRPSRPMLWPIRPVLMINRNSGTLKTKYPTQATSSNGFRPTRSDRAPMGLMINIMMIMMATRVKLD